MLQQQNVQTQFAKETIHHMQQVNHANDSDNPEQKFDAKEKGSNEYEDRRKKKKKQEEKEDEKYLFDCFICDNDLYFQEKRYILSL